MKGPYQSWQRKKTKRSDPPFSDFVPEAMPRQTALLALVAVCCAAAPGLAYHAAGTCAGVRSLAMSSERSSLGSTTRSSRRAAMHRTAQGMRLGEVVEGLLGMRALHAVRRFRSDRLLTPGRTQCLQALRRRRRSPRMRWQLPAPTSSKRPFTIATSLSVLEKRCVLGDVLTCDTHGQQGVLMCVCVCVCVCNKGLGG